MEKYTGIAFQGKKQINHIQDISYSDKIQTFISENETKGYEVIIDFNQQNHPIRQVYKTKR